MVNPVELKIRGVNVVLDNTTRICTIYVEGVKGNAIRNYLEAEGFMEGGYYLICFKSPNSFKRLPIKSGMDDGETP